MLACFLVGYLTALPYVWYWYEDEKHCVLKSFSYPIVVCYALLFAFLEWAVAPLRCRMWRNTELIKSFQCACVGWTCKTGKRIGFFVLSNIGAQRESETTAVASGVAKGWFGDRVLFIGALQQTTRTA